MKRASLLIYAKPPRMGLAKTRLAGSLHSPTQARRIAMMTMARTLRTARASGLEVSLYIAPDRDLDQTLGGIWPPHLIRRSQGRGDLTARLDKGLRQAPAGPVLFIGSDAPDLTPRLLRQAIRTLQTHDAVFGPASDGGFWLFGLHKTTRTQSPFGGVRWSGPHAMQDVWSNLPDTARIGLLPQLIDIDDADDWHAWRQQQHAARV